METVGKKFAVLGLARSGASVARLLSAHGSEVTVFDSADSPALQARAADLRLVGVAVHLGANGSEAAAAFDFAVLSPGIDPAAPLVHSFSERGIPLTGELEIAWQFCNKPVVAITGTNGKTTTTELIAAMLNHLGRRTVACGNIGLPFSEVVAGPQDSLDIITLEVSSFQLETIEAFRPHVALWLNFTPDHLDRYETMEAYRDAKLRIFENQTEDDFAICNAADDLPAIASRKITFSAYGLPADFSLAGDDLTYLDAPIAPLTSFQISGLHNAENILAALAAGHVLGFGFPQMLRALQEYRASPHRCEWVATVDGVRYINDSKSTNIDSLAKALSIVPGKIILIAGGKDKGFNFAAVRDLIAQRVTAAILIGEMAPRMREDWGDAVPCFLAVALSDAVQQAHALATSGDTVLLSPGTSSFDMFRDYADRGDQFRLAASQLSNISTIAL